MVFPFRISLRILSTFTNFRLLCQAHRILEELREIYRGMYQIHGPGIGEIRYEAMRVNVVQQNANQFSLCAFQIASPRFIDMFGGQKNAGRMFSVRHKDIVCSQDDSSPIASASAKENRTER